MEKVRTYLINMDRDVERLRWMQDVFSTHNIAFERISAVDGSNLSDEQQAYHLTPERSHLSRAEIGCLLSHIKTWQTFLQSGADYALIFEDDIHAQPDLEKFLGQLWDTIDPDEPCVHRLETFNARITLVREAKAQIGHRWCAELLSNHAGTAAYVLTRKSAQLMLTYKDRLRHLPDTEMFDPERRAVEGLTVFQWLPAPCIQDMLRGEKVGLTSNLASSRSDTRNGIGRPQHPAIDRLKAIFRPLYTRLYDLAIWPKGQTRKAAKYG